MVISSVKHGWLSGQMNLHWLQFKWILIPREKQWARWGWVNIQNKVQTGGFSCSLSPNLHVFLWHLWCPEDQSGGLGRGSRWADAWSQCYSCSIETAWPTPVTAQLRHCGPEGRHQWISEMRPRNTALCLLYCLLGLLITLWFVKSGKLERGWQKNLEG